MIKEIIQLLPEKQRKRGVWVAFSVLLRAILDFAGVAALIPILLVVVKQGGGRGMMLALCGAVLLFVLLKNALVVFLARVQSRYQLEIYREFSKQVFANYYHRGLLFLKGKSSVQLGHEVNYVCYMFSSCVLAPVFRMAGEAVLVLLMVTALVVWEPLAGFLLCASFLPLAGLYVGFGTETPAPLWHGRIGSTSQAESYGSGSLPWICRTGNCPGFPYLACFFRPRNGVYCSQSSANGSVPTFSVFPLGSSYSDRIGFIDWHWRW